MEKLKQAGMSRVDIFQSEGHPIVYGEWLGAPGKPTILVYGHYDVQPVDPIDLWESPPFEPTIKDGKIYARGLPMIKDRCSCMLKVLKHFSKQLAALRSI